MQCHGLVNDLELIQVVENVAEMKVV